MIDWLNLLALSHVFEIKDLRQFCENEVAKWKRGTYPVGDEGYQVIPEHMQHQEQGHQKVEDVVDWEHLDKLNREQTNEVGEEI